MGVIVTPIYRVRNGKRVVVDAASKSSMRKWKQEQSQLNTREEAYTPLQVNGGDDTLFWMRVHKSATSAFMPTNKS